MWEREKDKIANIIMMFFFGSIIGWIWEIICTFCAYGVFVKRGVLHGPWLPIYGIGFLLIILLNKCVGKKPVWFFIASIIVCGSLEYIASLLLESFYHTRWWSYRYDILNIRGRVCLKSLLFFGIGGSLIVYKILPFLNHKINKITFDKKKILLVILMLIFFVDLVISIINPNMGNGISESSIACIFGIL